MSDVDVAMPLTGERARMYVAGYLQGAKNATEDERNAIAGWVERLAEEFRRKADGPESTALALWLGIVADRARSGQHLKPDEVHR